jgi:hypothetical protein
MPRYEVVTHIVVELDGDMPEEAATAFKRAFLAGPGLALRGLAVWPCANPSSPSPLPPPLQRQLADFFAAVERHAAAEEEVFRARVDAIFADASLGAAAFGLEPMAHDPIGGQDRTKTGHAVERDEDAETIR